jgi:hypothetical protein
MPWLASFGISHAPDLPRLSVWLARQGRRGKKERPQSLGASLCQTFGSVGYLIISYMVTPKPLGQTARLTGLTNLVVEGTKERRLHASAGVAKKAPVQTTPSQTPAPTLAKTK